MCSQYLIKTSVKEISDSIKVVANNINEKFDARVRGFVKTDLAPVIVFEGGDLVLKYMYFSLCPSWSKGFPCKFTTYNARMERENPKVVGGLEKIYEIPSWKDSFINGKTCLVPMNAAIESSYFGSHAGNIIQLKQKGDELFFVAGLYSEWVDKVTGEAKETFTLITDDPYQYFMDCGHDRSVFVIRPEKYEDWLSKKMKATERFDFLRNNRIELNWDVSTEREMAKGWEKRAPNSAEIEAIKVWKPA